MELQIKITTAAELGGAEKAKALLEQTVTQKKFLNQEHAQEEALLKRVQASIAEYKAEVEKATAAKQQMASVDLDPGIEERLSNEYGAGNSAATLHADEVRRRRNAAAEQIANDRQSSRANREALFLAQWSGESTKATKAATDHADAVAKGAKQVGIFNKETRESQALLQALAMSGLPGVGLAATAAFSATTAGAAAAGLAVAAIVTEVQAAKQAMEEFLSLEIRLSNIRGIYSGVADATRQARIEADAFVKSAYAAAEAEVTLKDRLNDTLKAMEARSSAASTIAGQQQELLEAELASLVKRKIISEEQAQVLGTIVAYEAQIAALRRERSAETEHIEAQRQSLAAQQAERDRLIPDLSPAEQRLAEEQQKLANLEEKLRNARETLRPGGASDEAFQKADSYLNNELRSKYPDLVDLSGEEVAEKIATRERLLGSPGMDPMGRQQVVNQLERIKEFNDQLAHFSNLRSRRTQAQQDINDLPDQIEAQGILVNDRKAEAQELRDKVNEASAAITELTRTIREKEAELKRNDELRNQQIDLSGRRAQLEIADAGGFESHRRPPRTPVEFYEAQMVDYRERVAGGRAGGQARRMQDQFNQIDAVLGAHLERLANSFDIRLQGLEARLEGIVKQNLNNRYRR